MNPAIRSRISCGIAAILIAAAAAGCSHTRRTPVFPLYPVKGKLVQTLNSFDNPEGAIFSADGTFVFISNAAELGMPDKGFHWIQKGGYISKLAVQPDGSLQMVNEKLVAGLTGPMGMAVLPKATGRFPAGTVFVVTGGCFLAQADGTPITDRARHNTRLVAFSDEGKILGGIPMAAGSAFEKASKAPVAQPNALAFDADANLYVTDTGNGGDALRPRLKARPGVYRVPHDSLDALAQGKQPPVPLAFIPIPGGPDGVEVDPDDNSVHVNTVGAAAGIDDPVKGGMYRIIDYYFTKGKLPSPFVKGVGALDGLTFAAGKRLDTQIMPQNAILVTEPNEWPARLLVEPAIDPTGMADIAAFTRDDGSILLVIPDPSWLTPNDKQNPVYVVRLPSRF
ncbi:MAG TPA: hypothetical protein VM223_12780 [Planctomycetota bacterium]|nr:hypothetical protein [Planctomycetota bacterium]